MSISEFEQQWRSLDSALSALSGQLSVELRSIWNDLDDMRVRQAAVVAEFETRLPSVNTSNFAQARTLGSRVVLQATLDRWEKTRPLKRAEEAIEDYYRRVEDTMRRLPEFVETTGPELLHSLAIGDAAGLSGWVASKRKDVRPVPFRNVAWRASEEAEHDAFPVAGRALVIIAMAVQDLRANWDSLRRKLDACVATPSTAKAAESLTRTPAQLAAVAELPEVFERTIAELNRALDAVRAKVATRLLSATAWKRRAVYTADASYRTRHFDHWASQVGSLEAELAFERAQDLAERNLLELGEQAVRSLDSERNALSNATDEQIAWLDTQLERDPTAVNIASLPPAARSLVPAKRRTEEFEHGARDIFKVLPTELGLMRRLTAAPTRNPRRKVVHPDRVLSGAFDRVAVGRLARVLEEVQRDHLILLQQLERARQVVEFAASGDGNDGTVTREALANARTLLTEHEATEGTPLESAAASITQILADLFLESRLLFTRNRLGAWAQLSRLGAREGATVLSGRALAASAALPLTSIRFLGRLWQRLLELIGWQAANSGDRLEVERRPYLPEEFSRDPREKELPAIYRRLFRFEAVDDVQFLVGRDREIQAIAEARVMWEAQRPVSLLVVGERGSGKTSLINCALSGPLARLPVVRGEFSERVASAEGVRQFLAELCGCTADTLEETLLANRQVIVLEEVERTFLRDMNGFDGIRALQRLIAATYATTLWLVACNRQGFRLLHAAVKLGDGFSHRIDAVSATPDAISDAIMLRHHLSGLRLRFLPPPQSTSWWSRLRVMRVLDPETLFFQTLSRESAGVFRTAFEMWLGQIDSVLGGTMTMRPMQAPNVDAVIDALDTEDLFALVAITQHGSLTPEEHASVFRWSGGASRAQMDDLLARELIELEPTRPGYRVRPAALRVVREALHRRNLG